MPITITPNTDTGDWVGWGTRVQLSTDFIGPLPTTAFWTFRVEDPTEFAFPLVTYQKVSQFNPTEFDIGSKQSQVTLNIASSIKAGGNAHLFAELQASSGGTVLDTGSTTVTWNDSAGIVPTLVAQLPAAGTGLTTFQASQLSTIASNTADILGAVMTTVQTAAGSVAATLGSIFQPATLDAFTLQEVTAGETCEMVSVGDLQFFFGIVVKVTTIADWYGLGGLDGRHYEPQLALLNVFRGTEMVSRIPIHVADYLMTPVPGQDSSTSSQLIYLAVSPNLSLEVWPNAGNCIRVYLLRLP